MSEALQAGDRLRLARVANSPPRACTMFAPQFKADAASDLSACHIVEFQEKGITVIGTSPERAAAWRESEAFDRGVGNLHPSWEWAGNSIEPYSKDLLTGLPSAHLIEELRVLFTDAEFDAFFRGVLGCPAMVGNCRLVQSPPHFGEGIGPQSWHQDGCPPGVIRGVLYLTEVDEQTGPFQYKDCDDNIHTVLGHAGDLLVFDAMRLPHRAMPPSQHVRSAIDLVFMPRLPDFEFKIVVAGMNHWPADPFVCTAPPITQDLSAVGEAGGQFAALIRQRDAARVAREDMLLARNEATVKLYQALRDHEARVAERDAAITGRDEALVQFERVSRERDARLAERDAAITERDEALAQLNRMTRERDARLTERDVAVTERDELLGQLQREADG
jgi:hypothetical protein